MAWGQRGSVGVDDLVERIARNDPKLTALTLLRQRKCGHEEVKKLCTALAKNTCIKELSLASHVIEEASASALAEMLKENKTLTSISIGDSTFGDAGQVALSPGIAANSSLTTVEADHKGIGAAGAGALGLAVSQSKTLNSLMLGGNPLGDAGVANLCAHPWAVLQRLDITGCEFGASGLRALASSSGLPSLLSLRCSHNTLSGQDASQHLAQLVNSANKLHTLHLDHTSVGDEGATALARALAVGCPELRHLSISHAGITDTGGHALVEALPKRASRIEVVVLEGNAGLSDAFCSRLAEVASAVCPADLQLGQTGITGASMPVLGGVAGLIKLSLLGCKLGDEGVQTLATSLTEAQGFKSLQELGVSGVGMGLAGFTPLCHALSKGHGASLVYLEMGSNPACQDDGLHPLIGQLRDVRPDLSVHWRSGDMPGPGAEHC